MAIHRVNTLPEARPLVNGDEYIVKNTDGTASSYKVGKDGEPVFLRGLSDDDYEKVKNSYSKNQVDEKIDLAVAQSQGVPIPINGTVLPQGTNVPAVVTVKGMANLYGGTGGTTYTQTGGSSITVSQDKFKIGYYDRPTNLWTGSTQEYDLPQVDLTNYTTKDYVSDSANNLFESIGSDLFQSANLTVRRYTSDTAKTDYAAGYSQTTVAGVGDKINIPVSGSANNSFWVNTSKVFTEGVKQSISMVLNTANSVAYSIGIGYEKANGDFFGWIISNSGQIRTINNFTQSGSIAALATLPEIGSTVKVEVYSGSVTFFINGVNVYSMPITGTEHNGKTLKIAMRGFIENTFSYGYNSSPIKAYVSKELSAFTVNPLGLYKYDAATKVMTVYSLIKDDMYIGFEIIYDYNMDELVYVDYWRLGTGYPYKYFDGNMIKQSELLLLGSENECVFKQNSAKDDFTGGFHGDELHTSIAFYADGVVLDWNKDTSIPLTECNDFYYLEHSTMHETAQGGVPVAGHPLMAYHIKRTSINDSGYTTINRLTWVYAGVISLWYSGISCIGKGAATRYIRESDYLTKIADGTTASSPEVVGYSKVDYYASKYSVSADSKVTKGVDNNTCLMFVNDRDTDTKYYRKTPPKTTVNDEIWEGYFKAKWECK